MKPVKSKSRSAPRGLEFVLRRGGQKLSLVGVVRQSLAVVYFLVIVGMTIQVVLRSVHWPIIGGEEVVLLLGAWIYFLSFAYATYQRTHITIEILPSSLSRPLNLFSVLCSLFLCVYIEYLVCTYWWTVYVGKQLSQTLGIPLVFLYGSMIIGFGLICIFLANELVEKLRQKPK